MPESRAPAVVSATFTPQTDSRGRRLDESQQSEQRLTVDFNPEKMELTLQGNAQRGQAGRPAQAVTETTAKLSMELVFDSTTTGEDVRVKTHRLAQMMDPVQQSFGAVGAARGQRSVPPITVFEWGTVRFEGYVDTYRERIDFFSHEGVPLRAFVTLSLTQQEHTFTPNSSLNYDRSGVGRQLALDGATEVPLAGGLSLNALTSDPSKARALGAANGIENLRVPGLRTVVVPGNVSGTQTPRTVSTSPRRGFGSDVGLNAELGRIRFED